MYMNAKVSVPVIVITLLQGFPTCGTRDVFQKCQKSICFHINSHTEKCRNVNLVSGHFLLLLNCNKCKFVHFVQCCMMSRGLARLLGAFFSFL